MKRLEEFKKRKVAETDIDEDTKESLLTAGVRGLGEERFGDASGDSTGEREAGCENRQGNKVHFLVVTVQ